MAQTIEIYIKPYPITNLTVTGENVYFLTSNTENGYKYAVSNGSSITISADGYISQTVTAVANQTYTLVLDTPKYISKLSNGTNTYNIKDNIAREAIGNLATVATSGSYNDLSNKPTIPTVNNAILTIQKNGTNVATFTANASSNVTANISIPNTVSSVSSSSTNADAVGAKLFYDTVGDIEAVLHAINSGGNDEKYIAWTVTENTDLSDTAYWAYTHSSNITNGETVYTSVDDSTTELQIVSEGEYRLSVNNQQITPFMKIDPNVDGSQVYEVSQWIVVDGGAIVYTSKNPLIGTGFWETYNGTILSNFVTGFYYYTDGQKHYSKNISSGELYEITKSGN